MKTFTMYNMDDIDTFVALKYNLTSSNFLDCIDTLPEVVLYNVANRLDVAGQRWPLALIRNMIRIKYRLHDPTETDYIELVTRQELAKYHTKENE